MKKHPTCLWWLLILIFSFSLTDWVLLFIIALYLGELQLNLSFEHLWAIYLPLFAALFWLTVSIFFVHKLRNRTWKHNLYYFAPCLVLILTWAVIDIKCRNYQARGYNYLPDGRYYFHDYKTWFFMPYKWIGS